jgi:hypothetical protein
MAKSAMAADSSLLPCIAARICLLRGKRTLLDSDLAKLYGVPTKRFNEQVRRNLARFPHDFMFQLSPEEFSDLRLHNVDSKAPPHGRGGRRHCPYAFTEHGAIMAATILNSPQATEVCVYVVRAFVQFRQTLESHNDFAQALAILEARLEVLMHRQGTFEGQTELQMAQIFEVLRKLASTPESKPSRPIGFIYPDS